jgi:hypothetical protein
MRETITPRKRLRQIFSREFFENPVSVVRQLMSAGVLVMRFDPFCADFSSNQRQVLLAERDFALAHPAVNRRFSNIQVFGRFLRQLNPGMPPACSDSWKIRNP